MTPEEKTHIQTKIQRAIMHRLPELNDATMRKEIVEDISELLKPFHCMTNTLVQCDERNNTSEIVANNSLIVDVYFKEKENDNQFRYWNFQSQRASVTLKEIKG